MTGRVIGYQKGSTNSFDYYHRNHAIGLDGPYVDGVSITHGQPRDHVWTFTAAIDETVSDPSACPCSNPRAIYTGTIPPFVGSDTSVRRAVVTVFKMVLSTMKILFGTEMDVGAGVRAAMVLVSSARNFHTSQTMTLSYVYAVINQSAMKTYFSTALNFTFNDLANPLGALHRPCRTDTCYTNY